MNSGSGLLYLAVGDPRSIKEADLSLRSLRRFHKDIEAAVITDQRVTGSWTHIIDPPKYTQATLGSGQTVLESWQKSPFQKTLFLGTDTYIMAPVDDLFALLRRFTVAYTHGRVRRSDRGGGSGVSDPHGQAEKRRRVTALDRVLSHDVPGAFCGPRPGLMLFSRTDAWEEVIGETLAKTNDDTSPAVWPLLTEALWRKQPGIYILPPEYGFSDPAFCRRLRHDLYAEARPVIWHYADHCGRDIESVARRMARPVSPAEAVIFKCERQLKMQLGKCINWLADVF